jgi:hypothetical protein
MAAITEYRIGHSEHKGRSGNGGGAAICRIEPFFAFFWPGKYWTDTKGRRHKPGLQDGHRQ